MKRLWVPAIAVVFLVVLGTPSLMRAQSADSIRDFIHVSDSYQVIPNITYRTASNWDAKLDLYQRMVDRLREMPAVDAAAGSDFASEPQYAGVVLEVGVVIGGGKRVL